MKETFSRLFAATALSLLILGCGYECSEFLGVDNPLLAVTGDSIQAGSGCLCGGTALYLSHALLDKGLSDCGVASFAAGGATITGNIPPQYEGLKMVYPQVDIVLVNGGANDIGNAERKGTLEISLPLIKQAMLDYLTAIHQEGRRAVVVRIPYLLFPPPRMTQENMDHFNHAVFELNAAFTAQAAGLGFPVFALDAMMEENKEEYYADWIHPTCAAQNEMADKLVALIEPVLR